MEYKNMMKCLAFELTRRCNMNCVHCGKGEPQNLDMSKEIIDKALDEVSGLFIHSIRLSGGEPLLVPELISYLCDKIIEKKILVGNVYAFTNGTMQSPIIVDAFKRILEYMESIESEVKDINDIYKSNAEYMYEGTEDKKLSLIISDYFHDDNKKGLINETINYYNQIKNKNFCVLKQAVTFKGKSLDAITIEGNAKKNYLQLINENVEANKIRMINNKYCFIRNILANPNYILLDKAISVSANGNVYVGCISGYDRIDSNSLFNIMDNKNDFFEKIVDWCWEHPVCWKLNQFRERSEAVLFCEQHGIRVKYFNDKVKQEIEAVMETTYAKEKIAKDLHNICPNLYFYEISTMSIATLCLTFLERDIPCEFIRTYLTYCSEFSQEDIENATNIEWLRGFILFLTNKDKERGNMGRNRAQRRKRK